MQNYELISSMHVYSIYTQQQESRTTVARASCWVWQTEALLRNGKPGEVHVGKGIFPGVGVGTGHLEAGTAAHVLSNRHSTSRRGDLRFSRSFSLYALIGKQGSNSRGRGSTWKHKISTVGSCTFPTKTNACNVGTK